MPRDSREEFVLVLQTAADGSQAVRLRMMLKMALRRFGLRCVQLQPGLQQSGKFADATASNTGDPSSISR